MKIILTIQIAKLLSSTGFQRKFSVRGVSGTFARSRWHIGEGRSHLFRHHKFFSKNK